MNAAPFLVHPAGNFTSTFRSSPTLRHFTVATSSRDRGNVPSHHSSGMSADGLTRMALAFLSISRTPRTSRKRYSLAMEAKPWQQLARASRCSHNVPVRSAIVRNQSRVSSRICRERPARDRSSSRSQVPKMKFAGHMRLWTPLATRSGPNSSSMRFQSAGWLSGVAVPKKNAQYWHVSVHSPDSFSDPSGCLTALSQNHSPFQLWRTTSARTFRASAASSGI